MFVQLDYQSLMDVRVVTGSENCLTKNTINYDGTFPSVINLWHFQIFICGIKKCLKLGNIFVTLILHAFF